MKKLLLVGLCVVTVFFMAHGNAFAKLPRDFKEFKERYQKEAVTVEGAAHLYFEAVYCYLDESTRSEGSKMLRYAMHSSTPIEKTPPYTFAERLKDKSYHYIFRSFAAGTSPENNYSMSPDNFKLVIVKKRKEGELVFLHLRSSGADSDRLISFREYDGLWYTFGNSSTYVQVRLPKEDVDAKRNAHDADFDVEEPEPVVESEPAQKNENTSDTWIEFTPEPDDETNGELNDFRKK